MNGLPACEGRMRSFPRVGADTGMANRSVQRGKRASVGNLHHSKAMLLVSPSGKDKPPTLLYRQDDERLLRIHELLLAIAETGDHRSWVYLHELIRAAEPLGFTVPSEGARYPNSGLAPWQLKRSIGLMKRRSPARVEIEELADLSGVSAGHFSRAFKASTGLPPYQWQLAIRIKHAQTLLLKRHLTVEEIADTVGFVDSAHFTRIFKKIVGVTPGFWRKNAAAQC